MLRGILGVLRSSPVFGAYVVMTLVVAGTVGLITIDVIDLGMSHLGTLEHRAHDVIYGLLFATGVIGVVAQVRRPERNVSAMVMALVPGAALLLAAVLAGDVDGIVRRNPLRYVAALTVVVALLHPSGRAFFRSFGRRRVNWAMAGLVGLAAVPLLASASGDLRLQRTVNDMHAFMGHYAFGAALSFTVVAVGALASLRADGWRVAAWAAGLLPAALGVTSMLYADSMSSLSTTWALAALAWGIAFVGVAMRGGDPVRHEAGMVVEPRAGGKDLGGQSPEGEGIEVTRP
ncbi:MAG: hypothetical protein ACRD2W_06585 [Acidimicrobiales bacterium]